VSEKSRGGWIVFTLLVLPGFPVGAEDFERAFGRSYADSVTTVTAQARAWCSELERLGCDPLTLVPVVFPEILRFSYVRDRAETLGLEALYVTGGSARADYSIGRFQMKPSFVERLETALAAAAAVPEGFRAALLYPAGANEPAAREIRLRRLRDPRWQVLYLAAFEYIVQSRFDLESLSTEERIRFLAAAYNRGFWLSEEQIKGAAEWKIFPRGAKGRPGPYRYADIAVHFYLGEWRRIYETTTVAEQRRARRH
jgi:hypothetical protein